MSDVVDFNAFALGFCFMGDNLSFVNCFPRFIKFPHTPPSHLHECVAHL